MALGDDGYLYGSAANGGAYDFGTIFRTDGVNIELVHSFEGGYISGAYPHGPLSRSPDGSFYGTTYGFLVGTVYRLAPNGRVEVVSTFDSGENPNGAVIAAPNGLLFVATVKNGSASLYRLRRIVGFPAMVAERVHTFAPEKTGRIDALALTAGGDALVGTTSTGGAYGHGFAFHLTTDSSSMTTLYQFARGKADSLARADNGTFWGTASSSDEGPQASVFVLSATGEFTARGEFEAPRGGAHPRAPLVQGADGYFYGITAGGGNYGLGTLFRIAPSGDVKVLHSFAGFDGASPRSALTAGRDGHFYGVTYAGGTHDLGTVFRLSVSGDVVVLHSFGETPSHGANPSTALVETSDGTFFGGTERGGAHGLGTLYQVTAGGTLTLLRSFAGGADIGHPGSLVLGADGFLYGTGTDFYNGSAGGRCPGRVFRMSVTGLVTTAYALDLFDGDYSCLTLPAISAGRHGIHGSTRSSFKGARGLVFSIAPGGQVTVRANFSWQEAAPEGSVLEASDGNLYYPDVTGRLIRLTTLGQATVFAHPTAEFSLWGADIVQAADGDMYGTAWGSGRLGGGMVFRLRVAARAPG